MVGISEIVTKLIAILLTVYVSIKFVIPLLQAIWEHFFHQSQKRNVDIDVLIERQKQILSSGPLAKEPLPLQKKPSLKNKTLMAYQDFFQKLSSEKSKDQDSIDDVKKIFSLFDSLQWGEGPPFQYIVKKVKEEFNVSIEPFKIAAIFKKFIEKDFLLSRKGSSLPSYKEIIEILELAIIVEIIFYESISDEGPLLNHTSKLWKVSSSDVSKGFHCLLLQGKSSQIEIQKDILNDNIKIDKGYEDNILKILISDDNKFFQNKKDLFSNIKSSAEFFSILSPLEPPKDKNDLEGANKIFDADEKTSLEDIKKAYKKLAARRHPDKLSIYGISTEFEPVATKNFSVIQKAYDIILSEHKNETD